MDDAIYERFDTNAGFQAALERLLEQPGRELRIFDPDASSLRLNDSARVARFEGFEAALSAFRAQGGKGLNVTVPFKEAAYRYCDRVSERSRHAQVVNTLVFTAREVYGDTTDGDCAPGVGSDTIIWKV
mgnify:CR=1 FL=1